MSSAVIACLVNLLPMTVTTHNYCTHLQVVPETRLPPSLFSIPESSPFRPDSQEKDGNLQPDPKPTISCAETSGETTEICEVSCSKCKVLAILMLSAAHVPLFFR